MLRGFKFRLYPSPEQEAELLKTIGVCRLVYNLALEQRRDHWRRFQAATGSAISFASQSRELTELRAQCHWIAEVERATVEQSLRDLDMAFRRFFAGLSGYPRFRRRGSSDSFRFKGCDTRVVTLNRHWAKVRVPKVGFVAFRSCRALLGNIRNATISLVAGQWFVSFQCLIGHEAQPTTLPAVGIDRGVANTISLSSGEHFSLPASLAKVDRHKRRAQRVLARRKRGSNRRNRQLQRVARLAARTARVRRDWQHRVSTDIARRFGHVALEKLAITNMTASAAGTVDAPGRNVAQKRGLNRSILEQGWGAFATMLAYKLEERGGTLHEVPAAYTSQTCAECGTIDSRSRESQARFRCRHCGHEAHADTNAAREILRRSTASMRVEGSGCAPDETRTGVAISRHENPPSLAA